MINNRNFSSIAKFVFIAFVVVFVSYVSYEKLHRENAEKAGSPEPAPITAPTHSNYVLKDSIVAYAKDFLGTPYVAGGCSKDGFDCSGFVYFVYQKFDIEIPRSSAAFEHYGTEIPIENVEAGDLLLFLSPTRNAIGHIGIVSNPKGRKSDFIHASSGREMKVIITNLSNEGYTRRFVKAIRIL